MTATRFVLPLREGGSLPGLVEADDLGTYVVKFTGAGQGRKVLVAEVLVGELARRLDIPTPLLAVVDLPSAITHRCRARDNAKSTGTRQRIGEVVSQQIGRQG